MKAIILAAGIGSRLHPLTKKKPKTLIEVNKKPILGYILESIIAAGILNVAICVGFKAEQVMHYCKNNFSSLNFKFIENKIYNTTNNMYSLYLAKGELNEDIILMNADLVFDKDILCGLTKQPSTSIAVDKGRYIDESMKVVVNNKTICSISKEISKRDAYGCSIDVYKINSSDLKALIDEIEYIIENRQERNQWTEILLDALFKKGKIKAAPFEIGNKKWCEIDNLNDLKRAEELFK